MTNHTIEAEKSLIQSISQYRKEINSLFGIYLVIEICDEGLFFVLEVAPPQIPIKYERSIICRCHTLREVELYLKAFLAGCKTLQERQAETK